MSDAQLPVENEELRSLIKSQYHASLAMLRDTIERCPDDAWSSREHPNSFWQVAYHAVFFGHMYLYENSAAFEPWEHHQGNVQHEDGLPGSPDPNSNRPLIPEPYTRTQVLEYWKVCDGMVDGAVDRLDLLNPDCGFSWYKNTSKLEHQFISIRHIQHHAAQLADRLRSTANVGTGWVGSRRRC